MSGGLPRPQRVRARHIEWLDDRLSGRDRAVILAVARVRLLTGQQLERLAFADLAGRTRSVVRWRVLKRLADWRVLVPLPRRVGGAGRGSAGAAYALDTAGLALVRLWHDVRGDVPLRRPGLPGDRFVRHVLGVAELYVELVEASRAGLLTCDDFRAEPDSWVPDGLGGLLKPDAFLSVSAGELADDWWVELDLATEHLPTLRRKVEAYADFHQRGQLGPNGVMPRVLFVVPDGVRQAAVRAMLDRLPEQVKTLVRATAADKAVHYITLTAHE